MAGQLSGWVFFAGLVPVVRSDPSPNLGDVNVEAVIELSVAASRVYAELEDLDAYPRWLSIVGKADRVGPGPAWLVDLSTGVGPLRLHKRLRVVRVGAEP